MGDQQLEDTRMHILDHTLTAEVGHGRNKAPLRLPSTSMDPPATAQLPLVDRLQARDKRPPRQETVPIR